MAGKFDALLGKLRVSDEGMAEEVSWGNVTDKPSAFAPAAHKASHEDGGTDKIAPEAMGSHALCGFEERTSSVLSLTAGVFSIDPIAPATTFPVWVRGAKFDAVAGTLDTFSDLTLTYIYYDASGVLTKSETPWVISAGGAAPVAVIYRDGASYALTDERHGYRRNIAWHSWAHLTIGARYLSGLTGAFANTTFSVAQGEIYDEDLQFDTGGAKTTATRWMQSGAGAMRMARGYTSVYETTGGALAWDNNGTLTAVATTGGGRYVANFVYATNDEEEPVQFVVGQSQDNNLAQAQSAPLPTIALSTTEWKLIYKVIYRNIAGTATFVEAQDFRSVSSGPPTSAIGNDHAAQINRDAANAHPATAINFAPTTTVIAVADWAGGTTAVKTVADVTASSLLWVSPDPASYIAAGQFAVRASDQGVDSVTFTCAATPSVDITMNIARA